MRFERWAGLLASFLTLLLLTGCSSSAGSNWAEGKLRITTTTGMIADITKNVGGEHVSVISLMGPGVDPHLYKPTSGDLSRLSQAQVILYNGLGLESKMQTALDRMAESKPTVAVAEGIAKTLLLDDEQGHPDPHIWFDVSLWVTAVEAVRDTLIGADPANKTAYEANAAAYLQELEALHAWAKAEMATIPQERRVLVTAHDAFGYFGRAYDIEVMALQGISTDAEYGLADVQNLVDLLTSRKVKAVFFESSIPQRSIGAVVEGTKAKGHDIVVGGELFSDAMGSADTPEGTYIGMVKHNVTTIVTALK